MIETKSAFISKIDRDTLKVIFKPDSFLSLKEYDELYDHYKQALGKEGDMKFLVIIQPGFKMEKQYAKFFKDHYKTSFKKAEAFVILHPPTRTFFKVGMKIVKHKHEIKMFKKEEEALSWLQTIE